MNHPASLVSSLLLLAVAAAHILRIIFGIEIVANGMTIPMWPSIVAAIGPGSLAVWLLRERGSHQA